MRCTISQPYFGKELYMLRTDLLSIIRSLNTIWRSILTSLADSQHKYREFRKSLCTRLQCIVIAHARLMN